MATCPNCINATLDHLGEEVVELPDVSWEKMVRKKVDVYRCPACGHVERVLQEPPKARHRLGPISSGQIVSAVLVVALVVITVAGIYSPSIWVSLCGSAVFILLVGWLALTSIRGLYSGLRTKWSAAKRRGAPKKIRRDLQRAPVHAMPASDPATIVSAAAIPQEPAPAAGTVTVAEGVTLDVRSGQLEWQESRTARTCPSCKSARLIDLLAEDGLASTGESRDPTQARYYRCPSCGHIVREGPRALSKASQRRLVTVFFIVGTIESLVERLAPEAASLAMYVTLMAASLLFAYFYGDSE
jgi:predicted RNA-binding Zn-ribbon protein involved in translation (DUF1610 family)